MASSILSCRGYVVLALIGVGQPEFHQPFPLENERLLEYVHCVKILRQQMTKAKLKNVIFRYELYHHQTQNMHTRKV